MAAFITHHLPLPPLRHIPRPRRLTPRRQPHPPTYCPRTPSLCAPTPPPPAPSPPPTSTPTPTPSADSPDVAAESPKVPPFEIRGFSLANVFLILGATITVTSFSSYFGSNATASATSLGFVYGVPILLVGCALKYAELQPIVVETSAEARAARLERGTETQRKIYSDITRHRYGDEAHLSGALAALGLVPRGEPCPELVDGKEAVADDGEYQLTLRFRSVATPWSEWVGKEDRYERFFGPGVTVKVSKVDSEKRLVAMTLTSRKQEGPEGAEGTRA